MQSQKIPLKNVKNSLGEKYIMKYLKKLLCLFIAFTIIFVQTGFLSSCAKQNDMYITNGEWLSMVNESFGMVSYNEKTPYIEEIDSNNKYFDTIQIACEWNVIDKNEPLNIDDKLIVSYALITLVNCIDMTDATNSDEEKITYAIDNFDREIKKKDLDNKVNQEEAVDLINCAKNLWVNHKYLTPVEEISYAEGVKDFSVEDSKISNYKSLEDGTIVIPKKSNIDKGADIKKGDIYILPSNGEVIGTNAYKAENVTEDKDNIYISNSDEELDLYDVAQNIKVEETFSPSMENTIVYDGNGQVVSSGTNVVSTTDVNVNKKPEVVPLGVSNSPEVTSCATKVSHKFEIDDFSITLEYDLNGKFDLKTTIATKKDFMERSSVQGSFAVGVSDLDVTQKVDYSWFKLKEATMKVDYKTDTEFKVAYSNKKSETVAPKMSNGNGKFLSNLKKSVLKDKDTDSGAKTIKICSLDVWSIGVCRLCLDVNLQIKFDGSVSVVITEHGSKGLQYKNGNLRQINISDKDVDVQLKAKIEGTVGIGPALYVVGLKKAIIGAQIKCGLGVTVGVTLHLADTENHLLEESKSFNGYPPEVLDELAQQNLIADANAIKEIAESQGCTYSTETSGDVKLHLDRCFDVSAYVILKIELTDTSYAADILGGKITTSWEILGSKNAKFLNVHVENGNWDKASATFGKAANQDSCTLKYKPFDQSDEMSTESNTEEFGSNKGFATENISYSLNEGATKKIEFTSLPKGYSNKDIIFESSDNSIATVANDGTITGKSSGNAIIKISTKDKKYYTECVVYVLQNLSIENNYSKVYEYCYI